jgi:transcriptional regulator with XRE-family HTH domain
MTSEEKQLRAFGKQVASIRKSRGFTQQTLADKLDMHITSIGLIETGQRWPRLATLYKIADILGVNVVDLFAHTNTK